MDDNVQRPLDKKYGEAKQLTLDLEPKKPEAPKKPSDFTKAQVCIAHCSACQFCNRLYWR